ncbi:MAG: amidohydrolase family protein [Gemmatimonadetes bacterium]|nr:amidohydrolase family protein [Gemmatimonadota bacterium]
MKRRGSTKRTAALWSAVGLLAVGVPAVPVAAQETGDVLVRGVTVVDALGVRPGVDVVVREGVIQAVGPDAGEEDFDGSVIDGEGRFLIPGLIDAHVHLEGSSRRESEKTFRWLLEGGVTSVRDMAGDARTLAGLHQAQLTGELRGPALYYSGVMAGPAFLADPRLQAATRGYGEGEAPYMIPVTDETDVAEAVAVLRGTGATGVKLYADVPAHLVASITREAHRTGLMVWAHFTVFPAKPNEVVGSGVDGVSHAPYVFWEVAPATDDFTLRAQGDYEGVPPDHPALTAVLDSMANRGTVLDPTLFVFDRQANDEVGRQRMAWASALTTLAKDRGVTIAAGTDGAGQPLAGALPNVYREMELLVGRSGFTPLEALTAATQGGARALGRDASLGTVEVGKTAALVLLSRNPADDIADARSIVHVIQGGRIVR